LERNGTGSCVGLVAVRLAEGRLHGCPPHVSIKLGFMARVENLIRRWSTLGAFWLWVVSCIHSLRTRNFIKFGYIAEILDATLCTLRVFLFNHDEEL